MRDAKGIAKLGKLLKKPIFRASEARKAGVQPALLSYYVKKDLIERMGRGVYRGKSAEMDVDFQWEDLAFTVKSVPNGVVCLISALALYDLTEDIPRVHWIAIPHATTSPKRKGAKFIRMRDTKLGRIDVALGGEKIRIFDRERTIVDTFRYLGKETAIKALKSALAKKENEKIDLRKLQDYAKKLRVKLDPYIMAMTT